jgi:hypothetical protein
MSNPQLEAFEEVLDTVIAAGPFNPLTIPTLKDLLPAAEALGLRAAHGHWGEHPPLESGRSIGVEDWACEVGGGETRLGYWEWAANQLDLDREESDDEPEEEA